ncbi:MAG: hypothetical protein ATN36_05185 [Epulopiscium sp. Nele67-Bin005]|nr:MAG: hypothetical protein ATN36_05185 [Epulopiscium sp. Nele67-Bin005]
MKSLRQKMIVLLASFLILLVCIPLIANAFFLEQYYIADKKAVLFKSFDKIEQLYNGNTYTIEEELRAIQDKNNIVVTLVSEKDGLIYPFYPHSSSKELVIEHFDNLRNTGGGRTMLTPQDIDLRITRFWEDQFKIAKPILQEIVQSSNTGNERFINIEGSFEYEGDSIYVNLQTPLSAVNETIKVVNQFFIFVSGLLGIIGVAGVVIISNKITFPILEINASAKEISELNFDAKLQINSQDEMGQLANTINNLSDQLEAYINGLENDLKRKDQLEKIRKQFISNVSHELKTPLSLILGYTEGLKMGLSPEDEEFYCEVIEDEAIKMSKLVNRLLEISQLESGNVVLNKEVFDISELIEHVIKKNTLPLSEKNVKLVPNLWELYVYADYDYIEQVITNYLTNAINHVNDEGIIQITTVLKDNQVCVEIYNAGKLLKEEDLERIWESFYKVNKARTREYGGHGLGLYIVKTILEQHNGTYYAKNTFDGVIFGMTLAHHKSV